MHRLGWRRILAGALAAVALRVTLRYHARVGIAAVTLASVLV
jgi:hypothetical protein